MKNARLYSMQLKHSANVNSHHGSTAATEKTSDDIAHLKSIAAALEVTLSEKAGQNQAEKTFFDTPGLFNVVVVAKEDKQVGERDPSFITVVLGDTIHPVPDAKPADKESVDNASTASESSNKNPTENKPAKTIDLKKLRNVRIVEDYGVFSAHMLYPDDKHLLPALAKQSIFIEKIDINDLPAADAGRVFRGIAVMLDAQQFVKTQVNAQIQGFLDNNAQIASIVKLKKMYQLNHPRDAADDIYLELVQSVKLINQYQKISIADGPEGLPVLEADTALKTIDRFLPNGQFTAGEVTTAEDQAAYKLIAQARTLRDTLKLKATTVTDEELLQAVKSDKKTLELS